MAEEVSSFFSDLFGNGQRRQKPSSASEKEESSGAASTARRGEGEATGEATVVGVGESIENLVAALPGSQQTQDKVTWLDLGLCKSLVRAVTHLGYLAPTPVQVEAIPAALRGKDICARSVTGSGKTAAFLLPLAHTLLTRTPQKATSLRSARRYIRSLVLVPTRELGVQCEAMLKQLLQFTTGLTVALAIGGVAPAAQEAALDAAPDILIATPGRLVDYIHNFRGVGLDLSGVEVMVLDECDKMLTVTLVDQVLDIMNHVPTETRQVMLFSATMTEEVDGFASDQLFEPHNVDIGHVALQSKLRQQFVRIRIEEEEEEEVETKSPPAAASSSSSGTVPGKEEDEDGTGKKKRIRSKRLREEDRVNTAPEVSEKDLKQQKITMAKTRNLVALCCNFVKDKTIIFCKYRSTVHRLALIFQALQLPTVEIQGNQEQEHRLQALQRFSETEGCVYMLTTDVASRGLDIPSVTTVINYDLPPTLTAYIHRVGRTARIGATGTAISLVDETSDGEIMRKILAVSGAVNDYQVASVKRRDIPKPMLRAARREVDAVFPAVKVQLEAEELEERIKTAEKRYGKTDNFVDHVTAKPKKEWILSRAEQREREEEAKKRYEKETELTINRYQNMLSNLEREEMSVLQAQIRSRRAARQKKEAQAEKEKAKRAELRKKEAKKLERNVIKKMKQKKIRTAAKERRAEDRAKKGLKPYVRKERKKGRVKNRRAGRMKKH